MMIWVSKRRKYDKLPKHIRNRGRNRVWLLLCVKSVNQSRGNYIARSFADEISKWRQVTRMWTHRFADPGHPSLMKRNPADWIVRQMEWGSGMSLVVPWFAKFPQDGNVDYILHSLQ
jgi:hypothetical protein